MGGYHTISRCPLNWAEVVWCGREIRAHETGVSRSVMSRGATLTLEETGATSAAEMGNISATGGRGLSGDTSATGAVGCHRPPLRGDTSARAWPLGDGSG